MTVTLPKGGNVLLSDEAPGIEQVRIGLGWTDESGAAALDVDGAVVLVAAAATSSEVLLAHQVPNPSEPLGASPPPGTVVGDAEKIVVTLAAVPAEISRVQFGAAIYNAAGRRQTFRSAHRAYVRVLNHADGIEFARYTLEAETGLETAMIFGELYRHSKGWKFRAVGQGYASGLPGLAGANDREIATARPVDVAAFLTRTSRARSRRTMAEHLHPPRTDVPKASPVSPVSPVTPPSPPPRPQRPPVPHNGHAAASTRPPAPPTRPAPPAPPPAHTPAHTPAPTPAAAAARSPLDLSEPDAAAPAAAARGTAVRAPSRQSSASTHFGERSSRYRQRMEHVSALSDDHPATTWTEEQRGSGAMTVTLRWTPLKTQAGLPRPTDIDLGCLWQANDGSVGVMQTLGNAISAPGRAGPRQVLRLGRRDEREGQTIFVDLAALPTFKRFFVFAYGLHGMPEWASLRPVLDIATRTGEHLTIRLGDAPPSARLCVVASFHVIQDDLVIRRENDFLEGTQADAAVRYGWLLDWGPDRTRLRDAP